jgi:hypothetical protein
MGGDGVSQMTIGADETENRFFRDAAAAAAAATAAAAADDVDHDGAMSRRRGEEGEGEGRGEEGEGVSGTTRRLRGIGGESLLKDRNSMLLLLLTESFNPLALPALLSFSPLFGCTA